MPANVRVQSIPGDGYTQSVDNGPHRLLAWPVLDQQELTAAIVLAATAQHHRDLQGEEQLAIEVAMQTVVATGRVAQQQRRRPLLARSMTAPQIGVEGRGFNRLWRRCARD